MINSAPLARDIQDFQFKLQCRLRVFENESDEVFGKPVSVVASAGRYGLLFVGTNNPTFLVIQLNSIEKYTVNDGQVTNFPRRVVKIPSQPFHISVNSDCTYLGVVVVKDGCVKIIIYEITSFLRQNVNILHEIRLSSTPGVTVTDLSWNPTIPLIFAACKTDGTLGVYELKGTGIEINELPSTSCCKCMCWSPKGKQIAVGDHRGNIIQYKPDLKLAKAINAPPLDSPCVMCLQWISSYLFIGMYTVKENTQLLVVSAPKTGEVCFTKYDDICYSYGATRPRQFYMIYQPNWNILMIASSNSTEVGVLGFETDKWLQWILADTARAELPLSPSGKDMLPIGITLDKSSTHTFVLGESTLPPVPRLLFLSHHGILCYFNVVNTSKDAQPICVAPETIADNSCSNLFVLPGNDAQPTLHDVNEQRGVGTGFQMKSPAFTSVPPQGKSVPIINAQGGFFSGPQQPLPQQPNTQDDSLLYLTSDMFNQHSNFGSNTTTSKLGDSNTIEAKVTVEDTKSGQSFAPTSFSSFTATSMNDISFLHTSTMQTIPSSVTATTAPNVMSFASQKPTTSNQPPTTNLYKPTSSTIPNGTSFPMQNIINVPQFVSNDSKDKPTFPLNDGVQGNITERRLSASIFKTVSQVSNGTKTPERKNSGIQRQVSNEDTEGFISEMVLKECTMLECELMALLTKGYSLKVDIGSDQEATHLVEVMQSLQEFLSELVETSTTQTAEVHSLKELLIQTWMWYEEGKSRFATLKDPKMIALKRMQPLDRASQQQQSDINYLVYYIESQLRQANIALDDQWEIFQDSCKKKPSLRIPTIEAIYQTMVKLSATLQKYQYVLKDISARIRVKNRNSSIPHLLVSLDSVDKLEEQLRILRVEPKAVLHLQHKRTLERQNRLGVQKTEKLKKFLLKRPIKKISATKLQLSTNTFMRVPISPIVVNKKVQEQKINFVQSTPNTTKTVSSSETFVVPGINPDAFQTELSNTRGLNPSFFSNATSPKISEVPVSVHVTVPKFTPPVSSLSSVSFSAPEKGIFSTGDVKISPQSAFVPTAQNVFTPKTTPNMFNNGTIAPVTVNSDVNRVTIVTSKDSIFSTKSSDTIRVNSNDVKKFNSISTTQANSCTVTSVPMRIIDVVTTVSSIVSQVISSNVEGSSLFNTAPTLVASPPMFGSVNTKLTPTQFISVSNSDPKVSIHGNKANAQSLAPETVTTVSNGSISKSLTQVLGVSSNVAPNESNVTRPFSMFSSFASTMQNNKQSPFDPLVSIETQQSAFSTITTTGVSMFTKQQQQQQTTTIVPAFSSLSLDVTTKPSIVTLGDTASSPLSFTTTTKSPISQTPTPKISSVTITTTSEPTTTTASIFGGTSNVTSVFQTVTSSTSTTPGTPIRGTSLFGPPVSGASIFGSTASNTQIFDTSVSCSAPLSSTPSSRPSIFGASTQAFKTPTSNVSILGALNSNSPLFGSPTSNVSAFGVSTSNVSASVTPSAPNAGVSTSSSSIFGMKTTTLIFTTNMSMFGGSAPDKSIFTTPSTQSIFRSVSATTSSFVIPSTQSRFETTPATSSFVTPSTQSIFGSVPATTSSFVTPSTQSIFGSVPATTSSFVTPSTQSIFGSVPATTSSFVIPSTQSRFESTPATSSFVTPSTQPIFGSVPATSSFVTPSTQSIFGSPLVTTTTFGIPSSQSIFSAPTATTATGTSGFGSTTDKYVFGATSTSGGFGMTKSSSVFGANSVFGVPATSSGFTPTTTSSLVFGSFGAPVSKAPVFGQQTPFGQQPSFTTPPSTNSSNIFGNVPVSSSSAFSSSSIFGSPTSSTLFGTASTFIGGGSTTATSPFSSTQSGTFSFASAPSNAGPAFSFGKGAFSATSAADANSCNFGRLNVGSPQTSSAFSSTFNQNPFERSSQETKPFSGGTIFGGSPSTPQTTASSIFGGSSPFSKPAPAFGGPPTFGNQTGFGQTFGQFNSQGDGFAAQSPGPFSGGGQTVGQSGFGTGSVFQKPSAFGSSPSFGTTPASGFGNPPAFGSTSTFSSAPVFGNKIFGGESTRDTFGSSGQQNSTFANFANQNTLGFGNLAQQNQATTTQSNTFGTGSSFSSWR